MRTATSIHLNERECSAQRRYQKVLEESPSPFLTPELRAAMGAAAVQAARAIDYVNAGTVEFIVDPDGAFYFMEINTRLQVEHPVTELVTGLDLVEWQLRVAAGEAVAAARRTRSRQRGHAIEVRLYAEDPEAGFLPGSGKLERLRLPAAVDARADRFGRGRRRHGDDLLRPDDRQADRAGRRSRRARWRACARRWRECEISRAEVEHRVPRAAGAASGRRRRHASTPAISTATSTNSCRRPRADADLLLAAATAQLLAQEQAALARAAASPDPHFALGHRRRLAPGPCRQAPPGVPASRRRGSTWSRTATAATTGSSTTAPRRTIAGARLADGVLERAHRRPRRAVSRSHAGRAPRRRARRRAAPATGAGGGVSSRKCGDASRGTTGSRRRCPAGWCWSRRAPAMR